VLHLLQLRPRVDYLLAAVLKIGRRIVVLTPAERALWRRTDSEVEGCSDGMATGTFRSIARVLGIVLLALASALPLAAQSPGSG
jgi:hypothetical protein